MDELLSEFIVETNEQMEAAASQLVAFERQPSNIDSIASIYRLIHTIKGTCGFLDLTRLAQLTHAAESLISRIRDERVATPAAVSLILSTVDRIHTILDGLETNGSEPVSDDGDLIAALEGMAQVPQVDERDDGHVDVRRDSPADIDSVADADPDAAAHAVSSSATVAKAGAAPTTARDSGSIRVAVATVERIMRLVSELVLSRNQLLDIARRSGEDDMAIPLQRLSAVTTDLQDGVMQVRMQPIDRLFSSLPRLVRDLCNELDKKIDLVVEGSDTDFDRQLVELLRTPLVHIIRNCADHGIESTPARLAAGKPAVGRIQVSAMHEASHITIEIADDGRGLDLARIRAKAMALGLAAAADIAAMPDDEVCNFIFAPGFSTASRITHVSGRGIGMDIVRQTVESIGGVITISSSEGLGTAFKLKLPLTLAIAPALIVTACGHRFALPQHTVVEAVAARPNGPNRLGFAQDAPVLHLREMILPVLDLGQHFALGGLPLRADSERLVIVLRSGAATFGIAVDTIADIQEIVVKPLGASLAKTPGFAGNTILGDGSVVLILDIAGMAAALGLATSNNFRLPSQLDAVEPEREATRMIVFRAGPGALKALPLSQVSRIENVASSAIESSGGVNVLRRSGTIMPLVAGWPADFSGQSEWPVLVIGVGGEPMGLIVSQIVDIVDEPISIEIPSTMPAVLGSMVLNGETTEIVDLAHYMQQARPGAFQRGHARKFSVLLVDDKQFFRDLLTPVISAAGYDVMSASSAGEALVLLDRGKTFDAVVTDIDMPGMNGYRFAQALRECAAFGERPILAIDAHAGPVAAAAARDAGMLDVVGKFDRSGLIGRLQTALDANIVDAAAIERGDLKSEAA